MKKAIEILIEGLTAYSKLNQSDSAVYAYYYVQGLRDDINKKWTDKEIKIQMKQMFFTLYQYPKRTLKLRKKLMKKILELYPDFRISWLDKIRVLFLKKKLFNTRK